MEPAPNQTPDAPSAFGFVIGRLLGVVGAAVVWSVLVYGVVRGAAGWDIALREAAAAGIFVVLCLMGVRSAVSSLG